MTSAYLRLDEYCTLLSLAVAASSKATHASPDRNKRKASKPKKMSAGRAAKRKLKVLNPNPNLSANPNPTPNTNAEGAVSPRLRTDERHIPTENGGR